MHPKGLALPLPDGRLNLAFLFFFLVFVLYADYQIIKQVLNTLLPVRLRPTEQQAQVLAEGCEVRKARRPISNLKGTIFLRRAEALAAYIGYGGGSGWHTVAGCELLTLQTLCVWQVRWEVAGRQR